MKTNLFFREILFLSPEYDAAIRLRDRILRKPLNLNFTLEQLEEECDQFHFGVYDAHESLLACLTMKRHDKNTVQMRQVAVDASIQGQGIGAFMVSASERWAKNMGFKTIVLHARDTAKKFYEKQHYLIDGDSFIELNIVHFNMYKNL